MAEERATFEKSVQDLKEEAKGDSFDDIHLSFRQGLHQRDYRLGGSLEYSIRGTRPSR